MAKIFSRLTRAAIRKLRKNESITEHGITFQRDTTGDGVYSVNIMVDRQRVHRVVGRESEGTTRTQAEQYIAQIRTDAKHHRLALPKGRKVALTFRDAAEKYLERLGHEGGKDLKMKKTRLNLHLVPFFTDTPLSKITSFDIERYKKTRRDEPAIKSNSRGKGKITHKDRGTSPGTVNRELATLSHLLSKALDWGWIDRMPARIRRFKEDQGRIRYLTVEQAARLVECAKHDGNSQVYPFVLIGLETAMRAMEILSIRREHVDLDRRVIHIPKAKAGAREQPITSHLAEFLKGHIAALPPGTPWLFPSPGSRSGHTMDVRKAFRRVVQAAGMNPDEIVRHTLRHTAITHLVQAGVDLPTVKRISGHKTLLMVERYAHAHGAHIQAAMAKLEARYSLEDAAAGSESPSAAVARVRSA